MIATVADNVTRHPISAEKFNGLSESLRSEVKILFDCDRCGACCKNIRHANFPHDLDRGDGICKHLTANNLCEIYARRPIFCNVDAYYEKFLSQTMSREKFHEFNRAACRRLKNLTAQVNRDIFDA